MVAVEQLIQVSADDLVATASAGVTLAALAAELDRHGAWIPLDPSGRDDMTLGECLASGAGGPLSAGFGPPRDQVLGLSFVTRSGTAAKSGGRVVKNVAGFDLAKLLIGSRGRFGEITEAHLRLRIKPAADLTAVVSPPEADLPAATGQLMTGGVNPVCCEVVDANLARLLGLEPQWTLILRVMGTAEAAEEELEACRLPLRRTDASLWSRWRQVTAAFPMLVRIGADPASWNDAVDLAARHAEPMGVSITVPRGTVRLGATETDVTALRREAAERGWPVTLERGGTDPWGELPPGIARLTRRLEESLAAAGSS